MGKADHLGFQIWWILLDGIRTRVHRSMYKSIACLLAWGLVHQSSCIPAQESTFAKYIYAYLAYRFEEPSSFFCLGEARRKMIVHQDASLSGLILASQVVRKWSAQLSPFFRRKSRYRTEYGLRNLGATFLQILAPLCLEGQPRNGAW